MARKLVVEIVGDATSLDRSFKKAGRSAKDFDNQIGRMTRGSLAASGAFRGMGRSVAFASGGFLTGAGLTAGFKSAIAEASDLEQQIGKTNVVFGDSAAAVEDWSKTLANAFGLSRREALTTASTFGALFAPIGLTGRVAAEQSEKLTELGADLASFYNTDVASALDAIRSGIVGEAEPLRRYGVLLSETRVQQEALVETGKKHASNLTIQEKALARIALIYQDSKVAQGDFARTSDQAAQQTKILQANVANLEAELGATLLPTLNKVVTALNEFFEAASGGKVEGPVTGQGVETTLVPVLADRIKAYKKAGLQGKEILRLLRAQVGDSAKADDLIAEAFEFGFDREKKLRARIRQQQRERTKGPDDPTGPDPESPGRRRAREAFRQQIQDRAQLAVDRTQLTKTVADDIAALQKLNALLKRRIAGGHDTIAIEREQLGVQLQINDLLQQQADAAKARREAARQAALDARTARQFAILGLGPHGEERIPGMKALRRELEAVSELPLGKKGQATIARIRELLRRNFKGLTGEVRSVVQQMLDDLHQQLKKSRDVDITRFQTAGRGQFSLAGAHPAGTGNIVITGGVHLHGVQDMKDLENQLARRRKQRAHARRSTR